MSHSIFILLALFGGALLACAIALNSQLVVYVSPLQASWIAHGVGAVAALMVLFFVAGRRSAQSANTCESAPWWSYLGGIAGALVVVLAIVTVNGGLGVTGTLVLSIAGQVVFSMINDFRGWFGLPKRTMSLTRLTALAAIFLGSILIVYAQETLQ